MGEHKKVRLVGAERRGAVRNETREITGIKILQDLGCDCKDFVLYSEMGAAGRC